MNMAARYLIAAVGLTVLSGTLLMGGLLQRRIAEGERELARLNLNGAARLFSDVEDRLWFANGASWLLAGTKGQLEARQAEVRYWRGEYAALLSDYPDISGLEIRENQALQLTLARAHVRAAEVKANGNRATMLNELDRVISIHLQVLQNTGGDLDTAFNYEFLVRLRDEIAAGARISTRRPSTPLGRPGDVDEEMDMDGLDEMKVYVPSDMLNREATDDPTLGSDAPLRRRG